MVKQYLPNIVSDCFSYHRVVHKIYIVLINFFARRRRAPTVMDSPKIAQGRKRSLYLTFLCLRIRRSYLDKSDCELKSPNG